jgi:gametolysin peptidase M11/alpha-galactosidase-like protein
MGKASAVRGVVRALAWLVAVATLVVATGSAGLAQPVQPGSGNRTFAAGWIDGAPLTVTGEVTLLYADDFSHRHFDLLRLIRDYRTGQVLRIRLDKERDLQAGSVMTVSGRLVGSDLYVLADQLSATTPTAAGASREVMGTVSGDQRTLVIVANFSDKSVGCPIAAIDDVMFRNVQDKSVDDLYREMSRTQVSFSGSVVGPYSLAAASTDACDINGWAAAAEAAASSSVDVSGYARKVYVMPSNSCPAAGVGEVGVTPSKAWVFTCDIADVYAHELGHNLGMQHAATPAGEYADDSDVMGQAEGLLRQVNAPHKLEMGWIPDSQAVVITADGQYDVAPSELDPITAAAPQALKVFKADSNEYYYLSYRSGIGFDANLACCAYLDRLSVHRWAGPGSKTYRLAVLADGETFADPATGFSVTQVRHDSQTSIAQVHVGNGCGATAPSLMLTPRDQSGPGGTTASYEVTVVNNDPAGCMPSTFALNANLPTAWAGGLSPSTLQLSAGASGHATLSVTAPSSATSGAYTLRLGVSDPNSLPHSGSTTGSFTVTAVCTRSAPTASIAPASQIAAAGTSVNYVITLTNRDGSGCTATEFNLTGAVPSGWSRALVPATLTLVPGATGTATYAVTSPSGAAVGSYAVNASATDPAVSGHTASTSASYTVPDTLPPSPPGGLVGSIDRKQIKLAWNASTDNVGVAGYRIQRNGATIATAASTSWSDSTAVAGVSYTYSVTAYDPAQSPGQTRTGRFERPVRALATPAALLLQSNRRDFRAWRRVRAVGRVGARLIEHRAPVPSGCRISRRVEFHFHRVVARSD